MMLDDAVVLKLVRRSRPGIHPEIAMMRHLTAAGFCSTPAFLGDVARVLPDGTERVLAFAQAFVRNQGNGWEWTLSQFSRLFDDALVADPPIDAVDHIRAAGAASLGFLSALGRHLAEMHAVLSAPTEDPAFSPLAMTEEHLASVREEAQALLARSFDILANRLSACDEPVLAPARTVLDERERLMDRLRATPPASRSGARIRVHGALGLVQSLVVAGDAAIIGFGGDPSREAGVRAARTSAARDLASLLVSIDGVLAAALAHLPPARAGADDPRPTLAASWSAAAHKALLGAYREASGDGDWLPRGADDRARLIEIYSIAEACRLLDLALAADDAAALLRSAAALGRIAEGASSDG
jgi:maltose alpha-D-glucosyltransferase/alpha-amylase